MNTVHLNRSTKNSAQLITSAWEGTSYTKFVRNSSTGGFWANRWNITKIIFFYLYLFSLITLQVRPVDGFLRAIALKTWNRARMCLLGVWSEQYSPKFWGYNPKNWKFWDANRTFKPERQIIQILITRKLLSRSWRNFYREYAPRMRLRGWSHGWWLTQPNPRWRPPPSLILEKISIIPDWIKICAPNFMGWCITAMRKWPRDQKSKPEVNSRDVIKWTSGA